MNILDLNEHILLIIFDLCSLADLKNLYVTCKKFQDLIIRFDRHLFKRHSLDLLLTGHRNNGKVHQKYVVFVFDFFSLSALHYKLEFIFQLAPYMT